MKIICRVVIFHIISIMPLLLSCSKQEKLLLSKDLSLYAFIISDNDLDEYTDYIEQDIVKGLKGCPVGSELFLYIDRYKKAPILKHLFLLNSGKVGVKIITRYEEQCSTIPSVFSDVFNTMIENSSGKRYGLIYWSHGSGWLPGIKVSDGGQKRTRAIGMDGINSMYMEDLDEVLQKSKKASFIVFDACYMGSVEVAYTLRNSTDYIIACSTEILGFGFPYRLMIPELIKGNKESLSCSIDIFQKYNNADNYGDGTISGMASLIDCSQMDELASVFKQIVKQGVDSIEIDQIQTFDYTFPHLYYDFGDYVYTISNNTFVLEQFNHTMKKTIINKMTTPAIFTQSGGKDQMININHYSGLSTYILGSILYDNAYKKTEWYKYCYGVK